MAAGQRRLWLMAAWLSLVFLGVGLGYHYLLSRLPLVGVIQWSHEIKAYNENLEGLKEGLREEGYQDGLNIELKVIGVAEDRKQAANATRSFLNAGARVLITQGPVATQVAVEMLRGNDLPVVYTLVAAPETLGLVRQGNHRQICFTGTSMDVSAAAQLRFLLLARPGFRRLGIIYCSAIPQAVATGEAASAACAGLGLVPIWRTVTDDRPDLLSRALDDLLEQRIEALFIPTDPVLTDPRNLKTICNFALDSKIPVMVPDKSMATNGGLMSYHCDFTDVGRQSGRQAAQLLSGVAVAGVPPQSPLIKKLTLNLKAARKINLPLSRQLLCQANEINQ